MRPWSAVGPARRSDPHRSAFCRWVDPSNKSGSHGKAEHPPSADFPGAAVLTCASGCGEVFIEIYTGDNGRNIKWSVPEAPAPLGIEFGRYGDFQSRNKRACLYPGVHTFVTETADSPGWGGRAGGGNWRVTSHGETVAGPVWPTSWYQSTSFVVRAGVCTGACGASKRPCEPGVRHLPMICLSLLFLRGLVLAASLPGPSVYVGNCGCGGCCG